MKLHELFNRKLSKEEEEFGVDQDVVDDFDPNDDKFGNPSVGEDEEKLNHLTLKRRRKADALDAEKNKKAQEKQEEQKEKSKMEREFTKKNGPILEKAFTTLMNAIKDENVKNTNKQLVIINQVYSGSIYFDEAFLRLTLPRISKGIVRKLHNMIADIKDEMIIVSTEDFKELKDNTLSLNNNLNRGYRY